MKKQYMLKIENLSKSFGHEHSLYDVSFSIESGTVTCLLGRNGAGKSCLAKILGGVIRPDNGKIVISGKEVTLNTPREAIINRVHLIPQELEAFNDLSVAENIYMGQKRNSHYGIVNWKETYKNTLDLINMYCFKIDPKQKFGSLSMGQKQIILILRAISQYAKLIIIDEATTGLSHNDLEKVYAIIKSVKNNGTAFLCITHNPDVINQIADRVLILANGKVVLNEDLSLLNEGEIISKIFGDEDYKRYPRLYTKRTHELLRVENLKRSDIINDVSFSLYGGEILGLTGNVGAGRSSIAKSIYGIEPLDQGNIYIRGLKIQSINPRKAKRLGVAYFPEDRSHGLHKYLNIKENISMSNMPATESLPGIINGKYESYVSEYFIKNLAIKCTGPYDIVDQLSGGNQQKVLFSKWIFASADILILDEPTKDMDLVSKVEVYNIMNELKRLGKGILFISSDISELVGISDRMLILKDGNVTEEFTSGDHENRNDMYQVASGFVSTLLRQE